ncbi:MAG: MFS transporter [Bacillota bacterium]|nr:MFS transporter [Bacillota bacterium]
MFGSAFIDATSVLPVFLSTLTSSAVLIGLSATIRQVGWTLPQVLVARHVARLERKKGVVIVAAAVQRTVLFAVALVTMAYARSRPELTLWAFLLGLAVFSLADGVTSVPWTDIMGKCVEHTRRGRLLGSMQVIGGTFAFAAGLAVRAIISHPSLPYPYDFAVLFAAGAALLTVSLACFWRVQEPAWQPPARPQESLGRYLREVPRLFHRNPAAGRLVAVRILVSGINLAAPFFAVYGREALGFPAAAAGLFVSVQMAGLVAGGVAWARIADFRGNRLLVMMSALVSVLAPAVPLAVGLLGPGPAGRMVYPVSFFLLGMAFSGAWMGCTNYLLEITDQASRPFYLGAVNTLIAPFGFFGVLGGVIVASSGYGACFGLAAGLSLAGLALASGLPEPRAGGVPVAGEEATPTTNG